MATSLSPIRKDKASPKMDRREPQYLSHFTEKDVARDGAPLDFSFKKISDLSELLYEEPRSGKRKPIPVREEEETKDGKKKDKKDNKDKSLREPMSATQNTGNTARSESETARGNNLEADQKGTEGTLEKNEEEEKDKEKDKDQPQAAAQTTNAPPTTINSNAKKGLEGIKIIPTTQIQSIVAQHNIPLQNAKIFGGKAFEENKNAQTRKMQIKVICTSLILSYKKIPRLDRLFETINKVMFDCSKLGWIDLSHNHIVSLNTDFERFPQLKTLYLHCNYLSDMNEFKNLSKVPLISLTVHGNPVDTIPNFRLYLIGTLPNLRKIDTVLVSKKEKDNALVWRDMFRHSKLPIAKDAPQPPKSPTNQQNESNKHSQNQPKCLILLLRSFFPLVLGSIDSSFFCVSSLH
eukprot:TRINITY_DN7682_c0_g1_i1.p1 TRINITY_DN7682_c0_g1~~TRINITY_DN7682_c0_g1_i1.p1  ORF type:complete len:406 (-),score=31.39 TRINITY_DN7682_c0_g1_i1:514-1731(-)